MNNNWKQLASKAVSGSLDPGRLAGANKERIEGMLATLDFLAERHDLTVPHGGDNTDSTEPQQHPAVKVSVYMKQENGAMTASQSLEFSVDTSKPPAPVTLKVHPCLLLKTRTLAPGWHRYFFLCCVVPLVAWLSWMMV